MKPANLIGVLVLLICCAAAPATQPSSAALAIAKPLLAEADKQAAALGEKLLQTPWTRVWLDAHIRTGDWDKARAIIEEAPPKSRPHLYAWACGAAANVGNFTLARHILDEYLHDADARDIGIAGIASAEAGHGNISGAVADMKAISQPDARFNPLWTLAIAQARDGDHASAKRSCNEMVEIAKQTKGHPSSPDFAEAMQVMAQIGEAGAAKKLVAAVQGSDERSNATTSLAVGQASAGDFDGFKATLSGMDPGGAGSLAAGYMAGLGDVADIQKLLNVCGDKSLFSNNIRLCLGLAQVRTGDLQGALATAGMMRSDDPLQILVYGAVIRTKHLAGDANGTAQSLALAEASASSIHKPGMRTLADWNLAAAVAASGDVHSAITAFTQSTKDASQLFEEYASAADIELIPPQTNSPSFGGK